MSDRIFISNFLEVKESSIPNAGLGVFATSDIPSLTVIEQSRVKLIHNSLLKDPTVRETWIANYSFMWTLNVACISFGFGSLYNHNTDFNVDYKCIPEPQSMQFMAVRDIKKGEELFIRYFSPRSEVDEGYWIERSPEADWQKAEDKYLDSLKPDHRLERQPSEFIQSRKKNRIGTLKTMSTLCKKS